MRRGAGKKNTICSGSIRPLTIICKTGWPMNLRPQSSKITSISRYPTIMSHSSKTTSSTPAKTQKKNTWR